MRFRISGHTARVNRRLCWKRPRRKTSASKDSPPICLPLPRQTCRTYASAFENHQASGFAGAPLRAIQGSEAFIEHRPVRSSRQAVSCVCVVQLQSEQVEL